MTSPPQKPDLTETSPMDPATIIGTDRPATGRIDSAGSPSDDPGASRGPNAKGNTNIDTIIGRLVVDQGFATSEEVQQCFEQVRSSVED
ncbi:MAG: hypothetical protein ACT4PL_13430, partial [Phycisphaerales bacterium]